MYDNRVSDRNRYRIRRSNPYQRRDSLGSLGDLGSIGGVAFAGASVFFLLLMFGIPIYKTLTGIEDRPLNLGR